MCDAFDCGTDHRQIFRQATGHHGVDRHILPGDRREQWRQMGLEGWAYRDILPYFKRSEGFEGGTDDWHGGEGPLKVSKASDPNPIYSAAIRAGEQA
ncbi:MAG: hypothetical protein EBT83_02915, partial [Betaproteobacteria bacterium]|nr:hypothetical protein [Betaproteobacteria bacterium]